MKEDWDNYRISAQMNQWEIVETMAVYRVGKERLRQTYSRLKESSSPSFSKGYYLESFSPPIDWIRYHYYG